MVHARFGTPYGIDYNDPWVHDFPGSDRRWTKAWASARLAEILEPWAVHDASLITGVAPAYFADVLERHPHLRARAVTAAMPFGVSEADYDHLARLQRAPYLFDPKDGCIHVMYAGAILPKAHALLDLLMQALALLRDRDASLAAKLRMHFVGTGKSPDDPNGYNVRPYAERHRVLDMVDERPTRVPYLDVLQHLQLADGNLILGSTERHYTPSKAFQVVRAGRPAFAILHRDSTAARLLADAAAGTVVLLSETSLPTAAAMAQALADFLRAIPSWRRASNFDAFEGLTARNSARSLAAALDRALARRTRAGSCA
jgi:hypothetical protein